MRFDVMTLFPDMFDRVFDQSIIGRAKEKGLLELHCHQIREYTKNKQMQVDDYPYGGGMGMVMFPQPIADCFRAVCEQAGARPHLIYMSPQGKTLTQQRAIELAQMPNVCILCGHYEGVDERVLEAIVDEQISIGDYVLTGGEIPAMALIDCVSRMIPGVLADEVCFTDESHFAGLLEYPQYTRPAEWEGRAVPEILLSGHHGNIAKWRHQQSLERTYRLRPEMLDTAPLTDADRAYIDSLKAADAEMETEKVFHSVGQTAQTKIGQKPKINALIQSSTKGENRIDLYENCGIMVMLKSIPASAMGTPPHVDEKRSNRYVF